MNYRPDTQALKQAMSMFEQTYKVVRTEVNQYNSIGRNKDIEICDEVKGSLQVDNNSLDIKSNGTGEWENTTYIFTVVYPEYVNIGDIIITEEYGRLKVTSKSLGVELFGTSSYSLTRTGTINPIKNAEEYL